jgi:hypothetical protein
MGFFVSIRSRFASARRGFHIIRDLYHTSPKQLERLREQLNDLRQNVQQNDVALIHRATGSAITGWAIMEERLVMAAALLLKTTPEKTGLVFFSILNFQAWISIITELFGLEPDFSDFRKRWNKIYERLRAEKDNRDRLAHHYVVSAAVSDNPTGRAVKKPSRIDMRMKSQAFQPLTMEQINDFCDRVAAISDDLLTLIDDMQEHLTSPNTRAAPTRDQAK